MPRLFGAKLRYLRSQREMTQADLASQIALASHAHVANLEAGRDAPSLDLVLRVAALFGVTTDYLLHDIAPVEAVSTAEHPLLLQGEGRPRLFGLKLRALRLQHNVSQTALVQRLGLASRSYISNLEAGRKAPSIELVAQLAELFGETTDYLLLDSISVGRAGK